MLTNLWAIITINEAFDTSVPEHYPVTIINKEVNTHRNRRSPDTLSYDVTLDTRWPQAEQESFNIGEEAYPLYNVGDTVDVTMHHGFLGIPHYVVGR